MFSIIGYLIIFQEEAMVSCLLLDSREILSFAEPMSFACVIGQLESYLLLVSCALKHSASSVSNQLYGTCRTEHAV